MATARELFGNLFMGLGNLLGGSLSVSDASRERYEQLDELGAYYAGRQRKMLKVKAGKEDDNVTLNVAKKIVQKSANLLAGGKIVFDLSENEQDQEYIDSVWEKNRKDIFLLNAAKMAGKYKTGYIKILPDYYDTDLPRLERLHPIQMTIFTHEEDIETVVEYRQMYTFTRNGKEIGRMQRTIYGEYVGYDEDLNETPVNGWHVDDYELSDATRGKWELVDRVAWPYDFPPIIHWQNIPTDESVYGESDLEDVIELQDKINYNASKIGRIIRYHAHPKTWGRGFTKSETGGVSWGEDEVVVLPGDTGMLQNLEMQSDLTASMEYLNTLVQNAYDLTSTTNLSTIKDKLGQLTNFGLQVLYQDAMEKLHAKRLTFGEMLTELNRRLLVLRDESYARDGGAVIWPQNVIPQNQDEESQLIERDMQNGLVSKETARGLRGYDNDQEVERLSNETTDIGATILQALNRGQ